MEQFYCTADSCQQDLGSGDGSADWNCQNLKCTCRAGTTFCGAVSLSNLTGIIDTLSGTLGISCDPPSSDNTATCAFRQDTIQQVFGSSGLALNGCTFGECVAQSVIDTLSGNATSSASTSGSRSSLSSGVIAGLAVVGGLIGIALLFLALGWIAQRRARKQGTGGLKPSGGVAVAWTDVSYFVPTPTSGFSLRRRRRGEGDNQKVVLDNVSGRVVPGEMMAILGPSGAGKTTLIEILAQKHKSGRILGSVTFPSDDGASPRVGFVPQQDVLPPMLTVYEALLFAARLRLPEAVPDSEKGARVDDIMDRLGISHLRDVRIGDGEKRGISGGEMRRVSIGLELVARPDVLLLDEPTSGLDSVSASKVAKVLHALAHDPDNPTAVIASIHQPRYVCIPSRTRGVTAHVLPLAAAPSCTTPSTRSCCSRTAMRCIRGLAGSRLPSTSPREGSRTRKATTSPTISSTSRATPRSGSSSSRTACTAARLRRRRTRSRRVLAGRLRTSNRARWRRSSLQGGRGS